MPTTALRPTAGRFVAAGIWLAIVGSGSAQTPVLPPPQPVPTVSPEAVVVPAPLMTRVTLPEALRVAHARHPQLAALRASASAALLKGNGVGEVKRMVGFLRPDIEYRGQQADLGLRAAMAEYAQAEHEVTYAVVRCYFTVVYAREQVRVTQDLVEQLDTNLQQVRKIVEGKGGIPGITKNTENRLGVYLGEAKKRLNRAEVGVDRARAALREAMGLEPGARVDAADDYLPDMWAVLDRETVIAHAVTRRGEVTLALIGADVKRLEACAQWSRQFSLSGETFARGADIHARPVPGPEYEPDYKPGAIGPEMPAQLVGRRETRTATAKAYATRAQAAAAQAQSLVGLEAENAYWRYVEAARNVRDTRLAAKEARALITREREAPGGFADRTDILQNEVSASLARASFNEALYDQILALAALERATAGGVRLNFPGR